MEERKKYISRKYVAELFNENYEEGFEYIPMMLVEYADGTIAIHDGLHADCSFVTNEDIKTKLRQLF